MLKDRIGSELGMLNNLIKRQMAIRASGSEVENVTGMQGMIIHYLIHEEAQGDRFQKDIETQFHIRRSTATGILQLMERHGLVRREPVEHDARLKRLKLTEKARAFHSVICLELEQMESLMRQNIDEQQLQVWFAVCEQIRANLEEYQSKSSEVTL